MKFDFTQLRKLRESKGYTQDQVATIMGVTRSAVTKKEKGIAPVSIDQLEKIAKEWGVDLSEFFVFEGTENVAQGAFSMIPKYKARLSGGPGSYDFSHEIESYLAFRTAWIKRRCHPKSCALFAVEGDSMSPIIENGDVVLVDLSVSTLDQIVDGKIYAYSEGDRIKVKRLQRRGLDWWSVSENEKETYKIDLGNEVYQAIGRVVWVGHEIK